ADLIASATEHINEAVANERLTQDEADAKIAELDERIDQMLNTTPEERQEQRAERRQQRRGHHHDHDAPADEDGEVVESGLST
ncbi:MAG: hypothetical protein AAFN30_20450, partial [Actinomycetota bacterium]